MSEENKEKIGNFIDQIAAGNFNSSEETFNSLINDKVFSALEAEKISVAQTIYDELDDDDDDDSWFEEEDWDFDDEDDDEDDDEEENP